MEITLKRASLSDKPEVYGLLQDYIREFTVFEPVEPDENGIYPYDLFENYWTDRDRCVFLIKADGNTAGFIFVNKNHYVRLWHDSRSIAEFYVVPEYRHIGAGTAAARLLTESAGGWWQLMMHPKNIPSHYFWEHVFDYPGAVNRKIRRGPKWYGGGLRGTVMTFRAENPGEL